MGSVNVNTIKVGDVFQKYIRMSDGTTQKDGTITCIGFEKNSIILQYEGGKLGDRIEKMSKSSAQKFVFGMFLGATRL